ncbi:MAG: tetratricopeptide repeat protein [Candidatus Sulfotelmatobacter sp.]
MKFLTARILLAAILGAGAFFVVAARSQTPGAESGSAANQLAAIAIDYPLDGSVFPPEITPPTFLWRDDSESAKRWVIEVSFASRAGGIRVEAPGYPQQVGEIDPQAGSAKALEQLTPRQMATRTWRPDAATWARIKSRSVKPATITITGFADGNSNLPVSRGTVTISTSLDPVGAPVFYRDVPLMLSPRTEKGFIQPLPPSAIPLIKWRLRSIAEPESHVVMEKLYTCANCHSFSADGKTMGLDLDGPKNDKGLYTVVPVQKFMTIRNQDVIRWSSFQENLNAPTSEPSVKRFGFMSQISPDGRYVVTSIGPPGAGNVHQKENPGFAPGLSDRLFSINYPDFDFSQVFYPMRGILAWYDRSAKKLRPLPGADDPEFVQTSAFWSPDGKYLIFSRAEARDPYPPGAETPDHANDPREPQIQYDLYKIPFNDGKGGKPEPVAGASGNGMSNDFPKVSPDGRWIVFVQNHNGLLMRPDSKLYIVPFEGGKARLMKCNTPIMNSWHTFSPNGRWLAFSSKSRGPYTRLMLTHIDADGNDSPAIIVDNTTAANRAVNIPEFVNIPADGLEKIDPEATRIYRLSNTAFELMEKNQMAGAIEQWRQALQLDPDDAMAHFSLAVSLSGNNQESEAVAEYRKACALDPHRAAWFDHFAVSLALTGDPDAAVANWQKSLTLDPSNAKAEMEMGVVLAEKGQVPEGLDHLRKAVALAPDVADAHNALGWELAKAGQMDEGVEQLQKAVALSPTSAAYYANLAHILGLRGDSARAVTALEKAVELSQGKQPQFLEALADAYSKTGRFVEAIQTAGRALDLALQTQDGKLEKQLRDDIARYEVEKEKAKPQ